MSTATEHSDFPCPKCLAGHLAVARTRNVGGGINRVRVCRGCGHTAKTEERPLPADPNTRRIPGRPPVVIVEERAEQKGRHKTS